ncbi:MAG: ECF-type sigma factor [Isosphaeraceae bacterium]
MRDRDDLWRLLAAITSRKVARRIEREGRRKRGGGRVRGEADLAGPDDAPGGRLDRPRQPQTRGAGNHRRRDAWPLRRLPDESLS